MIITADRVITGDAKNPPLDLALRIVGDKITELAPLHALKKAFPNEEVRAYQNATILPGLIDAHTHISYDGWPGQQFQEMSYAAGAYTAARLRKGLERGVTTVRDVGSPDGMAKAMKDAAQKGYITIPRIITCNQAITMTGGHACNDAVTVERNGEWEIRKEIRNQIKKGADWIKIMDSESYRGAEFSQEELNAAVDEAHRFHVPIAVHAGWAPSVDMCVQAGFDSIEHGTSMTMEHAKIMQKSGRYLVPTILAFKKLVEFVRSGGAWMSATAAYGEAALEKSKNVKQFYDAGVNIACGTDTPLGSDLPPYPVALEAECMVEIGLTPMQAIETATKNGAELLRMGDRLGQIKPGYTADILIVDGDPSQDIRALQNVRAVYFGGQQITNT